MGEKYAVLISGDLAETGYREFWYDVVLMREVLIANDFLANHIYVLYGNGADFSDPSYPNPHYRPDPPITDLGASAADVTTVFDGLANGIGGYPQLTDEDLLFIWTFDHGCGPPCMPGPCGLGLMDGLMDDDDFTALVDPIPHAFRVICMQQCHSGGFIDDMASDRTVILTACADDEHAHRADHIEFEVVDGVAYQHGEFNFHLFSALSGESATGIAVNADANGDGFITMREVFDHIAANESQVETPQYDDGSRNLGERLNLRFADVFMRDSLDDSGLEPSTTASLCRSPDINHYRQALIDPQATLGTPVAQDQGDLFEKVEIGQPNQIYVRLQNRGYSASDAEIDIYWTPPSTLPTPASWNPIGTITAPSVAVGDFIVAGPLEWPSDQIPVEGHYCFVAVLGNTQDPRPDIGAIATADEFYDLIRNNNNVVWKNFDVDDAFAGGYQRYNFQIQGWPRRAFRSDLEINLSDLPQDVTTKLRILKRITIGTQLEGLTVSKETRLYKHYVNMRNRAAIKNMPLKPGDNTQAALTILWPDDVRYGAYEFSVSQKIQGRELGRVTKRIVIGDHPYVANRNTGEVHVSNCEWVRRMNGRNKLAFRELKLALRHNRNGCHYCLPEVDTG